MADGGKRSHLGFWVGGLAGTQDSPPISNDGGWRSRFGFWLGGFAGASVTPVPPPPPAATPSGGWVYDPFSRRRRRRDEDDEPPPPPAALPWQPPDPAAPAVDLAALDARIAALAEQIRQSSRGRKRMRERLAIMERERAIAVRMADWRRRVADDEDWFMLS